MSNWSHAVELMEIARAVDFQRVLNWKRVDESLTGDERWLCFEPFETSQTVITLQRPDRGEGEDCEKIERV